MGEMGKTLLERRSGFWKMKQFSCFNFSHNGVGFKATTFQSYRFRTISSLPFFRFRCFREEREATIHKRVLTTLVAHRAGRLWYCRVGTQWTQSVPKGLDSSHLTACWSIYPDCTALRMLWWKLTVLAGKAPTGFGGLWITYRGGSHKDDGDMSTQVAFCASMLPAPRKLEQCWAFTLMPAEEIHARNLYEQKQTKPLLQLLLGAVYNVHNLERACSIFMAFLKIDHMA